MFASGQKGNKTQNCLSFNLLTTDTPTLTGVCGFALSDNIPVSYPEFSAFSAAAGGRQLFRHVDLFESFDLLYARFPNESSQSNGQISILC